MEGESKSGKTFLSTKGIGKITKQMEEADLFILTEMSMKVNGKMTRLMAKVSITTTMAPVIMENGLRMSNKATESKNGLMDPHMKGKFFLI